MLEKTLDEILGVIFGDGDFLRVPKAALTSRRVVCDL